MSAAPDEYADVETSSAEYARRFAGPAGDWFLQKQAEILSGCLNGIQAERILDVAGGHGQTARALRNKKAEFIVLGSKQECSQQILDLLASGECKFVQGDVEHLSFEDKSFDVVVCLRYLSHTDNWAGVIAELCRVARKAVIVDFPPRRSFNILFPWLYKFKKGFEGNTRPYLSFDEAQIRNEFSKHTFRPAKRTAQFFFPMVLHRMLNNPRISRLLEFFPRVTGLTYLFGSPIIECFIAIV